MGEVYKARDPRLDRTVAIKTSREHFSERFGREAHAIAALNHPHICTLYDVGPDYLVMEYIEGETLAGRLAKGPLPVHEALQIAVQIAGGLDTAHRLNITHRDLKPQNIMLTRTGAKLLDFGLAKMKPATAGDDRTLTKALTSEGAIVGTYQYMAPETLGGAEADARTDIFSFGAVLYEMLTGHRAFEGASQATIIGAILHTEPPPLSTTQPLVSPALEHLVTKCLAKDPEERWQSARDVAGELQWIADAGRYLADAIAVVGDVEITRRIHGKAGRLDGRARRWTAIAGCIARSVAGDRGHCPGGRDLVHARLLICHVEVVGRIHGEGVWREYRERGHGRDGPGGVNFADALRQKFGYVEVARGIDRYRDGVVNRRGGRRAAIAGTKRAAIAGHGRDGAGGIYFADAIIGVIGDVDVAGRIGGKSPVSFDRRVDTGAGSRPAIARKNGIAVSGEAADHAGRVDFADDERSAFSDIYIP